MAKVYVDGIEVAIDEDQQLNGIQAAQLGRYRDPSLLLASGFVCRCQLSYVSG